MTTPSAAAAASSPCAIEDDVDHVTVYVRLGGRETIDRLVDAFYRQMDLRLEGAPVRALHQQDLGPTKAVLQQYLVEWTGGPALYSQSRGHPRLRMRHMRFPIGPTERDAWMFCMRAALAEVVESAELRDYLSCAFAKLADWVRNDPDNPHDQR